VGYSAVWRYRIQNHDSVSTVKFRRDDVKTHSMSL